MSAVNFRMRGQLQRMYEGDDLHFITFSCYRREPKLQTSARKDLFLNVLEEVRKRYHFGIVGYVVMPEHVHLLLSKPELGTPSTIMQVLKQTVSRQIKSGDEPSLWQRRFYDFNVFTRRKLSEKLDYMHANPVTRGFVEQPEDWQWSSSRHYTSGTLSAVTIASSWLNQTR